MNFLIFFLYLTLSIIIYGIIGGLLYKFYFKSKLESKTLMPVIDNDFWKNLSTFDLKNNDKKEEEHKNEKIYSSF